MKIFRLDVDVARYQTLVPEDQGLWRSGILNFDGRSKPNWTPPLVRVYNPLQERGNFFHFAAGALAFDNVAREAMSDLFERSGEVLPLRTEGDELFVLNVTTCVNVLEHNAAVWSTSPSTGQKLRIKEYVFRPDLFPDSSVFKIPETVRGEVLTYRGLNGPDDEFTPRYESAGLTGLGFTLLYEDGP